jgi:hypothetical protein
MQLNRKLSRKRASALVVLSFFVGGSLVAGLAEAREWRKISIPEARCADGSDYSVFLSQGDPTRLALNLQGGGACWDHASCYGKIALAHVHTGKDVADRWGWSSDRSRQSPVSKYKMIYFPYCTGDVHVGDHIAQYGGRATYHWGKRDFEKSIEYLVATGDLNFAEAKQVVLYGDSAGALGALFNAPFLEKYLNPSQDKVLIADSPGLHFGSTFWRKFTDAQIKNFSAALLGVGVELNPKSGNIAAVVPNLCERFPDWRISTLLGSRDIVMSLIFGDELPRSEDDRIFGSNGLWGLLQKKSLGNCSAWIPDSFMHTFFKFPISSRLIRAGRKSARGFADDVIAGTGAGRSYRD